MPIKEPIELHKVYHVKLSGERVWVIEPLLQGMGATYTESYRCRRLVHTHDEGDLYVYEEFTADELQTQQDHERELEVERAAMARLLKANGISVLSTDSPLHEMFHDHEKN